MKFGLANIATLCARSAIPRTPFPRSSSPAPTARARSPRWSIRALRAAGHRSARYTSPHLQRLEERFVIDGAKCRPGARGAAAPDPAAAEALVASGGSTRCRLLRVHDGDRLRSLSARRGSTSPSSKSASAAGSTPPTSSRPIAAAIVSIDFDHEAQLGARSRRSRPRRPASSSRGSRRVRPAAGRGARR
jgi:hypothetical protein